jgi:predicted dehydrogenase/nucleoside-diphosphate-sugar epimerase
MKDRKTRVGLVGAGYVASRHLMALKALSFVDVVGICDVDLGRASELATRFRIPRAYDSLSAMAEAGLDVVHVLTPPASHCALALQALDLGCHVFVEKPMAETVAECDRMIEAAARRKLVLSVNHSMLFGAPVARALEHVRNGDCGTLLAFTYFRGSDYPPYSGGAVPAMYRQGSYPFRDLGVHALYLTEAFLGPIASLDTRRYSTGADEMLTFDEWRLDADCASGTAHVLMSWNMRPMQNEFWVQGTRGLVHVDVFLDRCRFFRTYPGPKQLHSVINGMRHAVRDLFAIPWYLVRAATGMLKPSSDIYESVIAFHSALAKGQPPPVSAEEGRRAVAWVVAGAAAADAEKDQMEAARAQQQPAPARVLVTGGSGFLGSALLRRLRERGERPRVLLRRHAPAGAAADGLDAVYGSLGEPEVVDRAVAGVDVVYHVGAAMKGWAEHYQAGTIWGTRNIVEACLRHKVRRLVYVSSMGVLDHAGHPDGVTVNEASPLEPRPQERGVYTQTKLEAERIVLDAMRNRGLPAVIVRPGQIFGPSAEQVSPNGVFGIAGQWIVAGSGNRHLPLVFVDDVVDGLLAAASAPGAVGQIVHLIDPTPVTQNEYLQWCRPALPGTGVWRMPVWLLMVAAWMIDLMSRVLKRSLPLSRYKIRALKPLWPVDITRARQLLGWEPRVGSTRGLALTFERFRDR